MICACGTKLGRQNRVGLCRPCCARRNLNDPVISAKMRAALDRFIRSPKARADSSRRLKAQQRARLAWCPDDHLAEYRRLCKSRKSAAVARSIIESRLTPFERAMQRVKSGYNITEISPIRSAEPQFSLTGTSAIYECG